MPHPQVEQLAKILQRQFGDLGTILLEQECLDLGTTVERIRPDQIPVLIERLGEIVTDILGVKYAQTGLRQIARLA